MVMLLTKICKCRH